MRGFRETLETCHLGDLCFSGSMFTRCNRRTNRTFTKERLDRAVANPEWCAIFPIFSVLILAARSSDHSPMLVSFFGCHSERQAQGSFRRGFKFEASWANDIECMESISSAWNNDLNDVAPLKGIRLRLSACQRALSTWSRQKYGNVEENIKRKSAQLATLQRDDSLALVAYIKTLQHEIEELLEFEDMRWRQRAKQHWLQHGDQNTTFFHFWGQHRRKINHIRSISDEQGRVWRKNKDISKAFLSYYEQLFSTQSSGSVEECIRFIDSRITDEMNNWLLHSFSEEEVQRALFQMHPLKSLAWMGILQCFIKRIEVRWEMKFARQCSIISIMDNLMRG
jgi:hypothetical protein